MATLANDDLLEGLKRGDVNIVRLQIRDRLLAAVLDLLYLGFLWVAAAWVLRDPIDDKATVFAWLNVQQTAGLIAGTSCSAGGSTAAQSAWSRPASRSSA